MECDRAGELMMQFMDKTLTEEDAKHLNLHLRTCSSCKEDFYAYDRIMNEFSVQKIYSPPDGFEDAVMERIRALDFKRPLSASKDSFLCIIWGVFSILFGLGFIAFMYKDALIGLLSASESLSGFVQTLAPVSDFVGALAADLTLAVTATGVELVGLVSPFRFALLLIFIVLAGVQYYIHRKSKVEI